MSQAQEQIQTQTQQEQTQEQQVQQQIQQIQTQEVEQHLRLTLSGIKIHSPKKYRRHLYVELEGDVSISKCIEWLNRIVPVEVLDQIYIEPATGLEQALMGIDIIENRYRSIVINVGDNKVEFELKASTSKHDYDITLLIEKGEVEAYRVVVSVTIDEQKRFSEEVIKDMDGFDSLKLPTVIVLKRFSEFLRLVEKIVKAYRLLEKIQAACIYSSALQLYVCQH